ncbi:MAG: AMP-binding protein [Proteobacteria bacterium]|nr:AMP-binding protein [Pseudomonadota bacterium]
MTREAKAAPAPAPGRAGVDINHLLDQAVANHPGKTALIDAEDRSVTFAETAAMARGLAAAYRAAGARPGDRLAHILPNGIPFIVTELAALQCGLVKVPLNIRFAEAEVLYALIDCAPRILVCESRYADAVLARRDELPDLEAIFVVGGERPGCASYDEAVRGTGDGEAPHRYGDEAPVLIRYTGGTTGRPKGIVHTHRAFRAANLDVIREFAFAAGDTILHLGHLSHGLNFMWGAAWATGATQIPHERFDARAVLDAIERHKVTYTYMVPTMVQRLLREDDGTADVSSLRMFMYASAPMPVPVLRAAMARYGPIFTQVYTSSEAPVITTILRAHEHIDRDGPAGNRLASCGRAVATMEIRLLDDDGEPVAEGEVGEIVVRSENNMEGYWRLEEETAAALRDGWYFTGDMARRDDEGFLYIVDRKKDIIITGGFNVWPKEVEDALYSHPAVAQAAVVGVPDEEWGEAVKAFIVPKPGATPGPALEAELTALCREHLAGYKKPRRYEFAESLPLSPVGKIMRRALRDREWAKAAAETGRKV